MKLLLTICILFFLNNIPAVSSQKALLIKIDKLELSKTKLESSVVTLSDSSNFCFNEATTAIEIENLQENKLSAYAEITYVKDSKSDTIYSDGNVIDKIRPQNKTIKNINVIFINLKKQKINIKYDTIQPLTFLQLSKCNYKETNFKKNENYYYIPEYKYDSISTAKIKMKDDVGFGQDLLSFDIKQGKTKLHYYRGNGTTGKENPINDFKAVVGDYVTLKVYSEIGDSISITNNYTNLHLENQSQFQSLVNQQIDSLKNSSKKNGNGIAVINSGEEKSINNSTEKKDLNEKIMALSSELGIYLQYVTKEQPLKKQWTADVLYIKENICKKLGMIDFSLDSLKAITNNRLIVDQWKAIESYNPPIYISTLPKQIENNDILTFNVQLYNKGKEIQSGTYNYYTKYGFKVDYSVGIVFHTLTDESYSIIQTTDNAISSKKLVKERSVDITPGAGLFAHFYPRTGGWFNYGLMTGFEIAADSKPKYLAGLSLLLGREQRVVISPGIILGQVKVLSSKYDLYKTYPSSSFGDISVDQLLVNQYQLGYFISISYNLSK